MKMKTVQSAPIVQIVQEFSTTGGVETVALELSRAFSRAHMANCVLASKVDGVVISGTNVEMVGSVLAKLPTRGALRYIGRALVVPLFTVAATLAARRYASSVIISHGDSLAGEELQHYYKVPQARIQIIPNGIDLERFKPAPQTRSDMRAAFNIPAKAKVLLFAGHEFGRKGLEYVIRAMDMVDDDIWLMVVGSDNPEPYRQIAPGLKERIIFAGSRKNMPDFYAAADAFVFPTNYETFSLVCMEALASGLPILATRVGGIEDYLQEGGNGYFITRAPAAIADKIRMVFADPANYLKLSAGAVATAQTYGWDAVAAQYLALIAEVANEKARSDPESPAKNGA